MLFCAGTVMLACGAYVWGRAILSVVQVRDALAPASPDAQAEQSDFPPTIEPQSPSSLHRRAPDIQDDDSLIRAWQLEQDEKLRDLAERQAARGDLTTDDNVGAADYKGAQDGLYARMFPQ